MGIDKDKTPLLFSAGTYFAYKIAERYYNNMHYVWCARDYDSKTQPPTSNPLTICKRFLEQIKSGDRHTNEIDNNKAGILKGAKAKLKSGVITKEQYKEICQLVATADYEAFFPILYIIPVDRINDLDNRCIEVPIKNRASDDSFEYKIEDLDHTEFSIISFKKLLDGLIDYVDKKAGE